MMMTEFGKCFLDARGYYYFCVYQSGKQKNIKLHTARYERHHGPLKKGFIIHHRDGVKTNNDIENLEAMTQKDHVRLHSGWIRTNGAWTHKTCSICKESLPLSDFSTRRSRSGLPEKVPIDFCKACGNIRKKIWSDSNRNHVRKKANENYHKRVGNI